MIVDFYVLILYLLLLVIHNYIYNLITVMSQSIKTQPKTNQKKQSQNNQSQLGGERQFQKWLKRNQVSLQSPVQIQNSFKNFQDPISYTKDKKIKMLEYQAETMRQDMKFQKQSIAEMSKLNYKKVISRDKTDYQFGPTFRQQNWHYRSGYQQLQKRSTKKKGQNTKINKIRSQLIPDRQFHHNLYKFQQESGNQQKPLTLQVIKQIDTKDFDIKHKNVQFFEILSRTHDTDEKYTTTFSDISENYDMDQLINEIKFEIIDKDSFYSSKSELFLFKAEDQLDFWRKYSNQTQEIKDQDDIQVMKKCQNLNPKQPSYLHLLDFAAGKLDTQTLSTYLKLKAKHEAELKINENDQNLEQQYNKKKQQYDVLREMKVKDKTQRVAVKLNPQKAQTLDDLQDQSFQSYFEQTAKDLLLLLQELNKTRDTVLQKRQTQSTRKVMLMNIGYEIKQILFKLLALTLKGQTFINYQQLLNKEEKSIAQRKMLQIIYHQFNKVKVLEVDGISKVKILDIYLEERQKNQKMFQLLGRVYGSKTNKTPTKNAKSKQKAGQKTTKNIKNK